MNRRSLLRKSLYISSGLMLPTAPFLTSASTSQLQSEINQLIQKKRRQGLVKSDERTAWSIYDFKSRHKLVSINESRSMQSASLIKPFVAVAYCYLNKVNPSKYPLGSNEKNLMRSMIVRSSNNATNTLMRRCGGPSNIRRLCEKATNASFRQLKMVEYIPQGGKTYLNLASAHDHSKLLYAIFTKKVYGHQTILSIMREQNADRIRTRTNLPSYLNIYDKTGSTARCCAEMGVVEVSAKNKQAYTFIAIIDKSRRSSNYTQWIRTRGDVIREVSELTYKFMTRHYQLMANIG